MFCGYSVVVFISHPRHCDSRKQEARPLSWKLVTMEDIDMIQRVVYEYAKDDCDQPDVCVLEPWSGQGARLGQLGVRDKDQRRRLVYSATSFLNDMHTVKQVNFHVWKMVRHANFPLRRCPEF